MTQVNGPSERFGPSDLVHLSDYLGGKPMRGRRIATPQRLHRPVNTRPQGRLGQRRARTRVIEPRNLNRFFDELIAKVGGSNPSGCANVSPCQISVSFGRTS